MRVRLNGRSEDMAQQTDDFYQALRKRIRAWLESGGGSSKWAEYIMLAPDILHLLCKLTIDPEVPVKEKAKVAAAIAYFVSPIDLVPEAIVGPLGYVEDVVLSAYVLTSIINTVGQTVVTKHWAGDRDLLQVIQEILKIADEMVGGRLWRRLKGLAT